MADKRGRQDTHDTGSPTSRGRDDLRTATKKSKPFEQRAEGRDKSDTPTERHEKHENTEKPAD